jgi:hypothetical protein
MRQPQNAKRGRGRGRRGNNNSGHNHVPNRNTSYESNGPEVKLRGNAQQLHEKYMALAHDAATSGERISAEAFTQFADHYFRLHQAAVGVAETKRQQDQADAVEADESKLADSKAALEPGNKNGVDPALAQPSPTEGDGLAIENSANANVDTNSASKSRSNAAKTSKTRVVAKAGSEEGAKSSSDQLNEAAQTNQEGDQPS